MDKPIRILVLEDKATDAEILIREVKRAGYAPQWTRVETEADFLSELNNAPDLILSDFGLPHFDGLQAVTLLRKRGMDTPFILVSGSIGEEAAVESMKMGANDYLLKDRTARLGPAIDRVLQEKRLRTESKWAEEELLATHSQLHQLLEQSPAVIYALKIQGKEIVPYLVSENIMVLLGFTVQECITYDWWVGQLHPEDRERAVAGLAETITLGASLTEYRIRHKDGSYRWVEDHRRLVRDADEKPRELTGVWTDVTERKRAEEILHSVTSRESALRKKRILREAFVMVGLSALVFALGNRFDLFLPAFRMLSDRQKHPLADEAFGTLAFLSVGLLVFSYRRWRESVGEARSQQHAAESMRVLHDELDQRVQRRTAELARSNTALQAEVVERQRAESALRESERRFADMLAKVELVSIMLDAKAQITYCNDYLLQMTGRRREEVLGRDWFELFIPAEMGEALRGVHAALLADQPSAWHHENEILTRSGERRRIRWNNTVLRSPGGEVTGMASIGEDITDRHKNERLALRSQRLEAIGTLAGGVAHDLNNALAPIMMGLELIKSQHPEDSEIVDMFQSSARRGADMVRQLLSFAKGAEGERVLIAPSHLLKEMAAIINGSFPKNIQLVCEIDSKLPTVLGDTTQLHQVLLNLCVNARDAMPDGGTITLQAQRKEIDAAYASSIPDGKPGNFVMLRVRDTGSGIPPEILDRIFEPFFTTKGPEKGTGLGLSTVLGIVKGHGGFLHVYSQPGQGSTFAAYLPEDTGTGEKSTETREPVAFHGQGETILFVDDEPAVREVARGVLRRLNFKPLTARDGADGMIQASQHRAELRAIITDQHMPHLDGVGFVRSLRRMLPDMPVLVTSGRLDDSCVAEFKTLGVINRLSKPFSEAQLASALRELLHPNGKPIPNGK